MRTKFRVLILFVLMISVLHFLSCSNATVPSGNDISPSLKEKIKSSTKQLKLSLEKATNLYIGKTTGSNLRSSLDSENKLFKITEDGYSQEITYEYEVTTVIEYEENIYDTDGNITGKETKTRTETSIETATESFVPTSIIKLTQNFVIVCFSEDNYLVDTSTGYSYKYTETLPYIHSSIAEYYGDSIQTDSDNNIYFVTETDSKLYKLDITNPNEVSLTLMSPKNETVSRETWGVDKNGNIAYEGRDASGNGVLRFKNANGGFVNLPGNTNHSSTMFWQGLDGLLYYFNGSNQETFVKKINNNPYSVENYEENYDGDYSDARNMGQCGFKALLKAKNKNRTILLADGSAYPEFYEVYNLDTNKLKKINVNTIGLSQFKFGIASDDYYYFVGKNTNNQPTLVKVDPVSYSFDPLLNDGLYDVYNLSLSDDSIIFNALRMSDGAIILGKINANKTIDVIEENLEEEITVLERIN